MQKRISCLKGKGENNDREREKKDLVRITNALKGQVNIFCEP